MRTSRTLLLFTLCFALPLAARDLGRFNGWDESPAGLFMTKSERAEWSTLRTAADAERFVDAFMARRGDTFAADVAERAAMADKYLTVGKTAGSRSLRGKVIILFGPPSGISVNDRSETAHAKRDNPLVAGALSNVGSVGAGGRAQEDTTAPAGSLATARAIRAYAITYSGDAARLVNESELTFMIEADLSSGKDRFQSRTATRLAEDLFERAARASIKR